MDYQFFLADHDFLCFKDTSNRDGYTLSSIRVFTQSVGEVSSLSTNGVTAQWAIQEPAIPIGEIGGIEGDQYMYPSTIPKPIRATTPKTSKTGMNPSPITSTVGINI
jgi:alpha-D-ribose 1-methylphosphonate 5-phosphate C-P lyase